MNSRHEAQTALERLGEAGRRVRAEIGKVIVGQDEVVEQLLTCLLSNGHCVLVGVPGLAKTLLINTLSRAIDLSFNRIQFTPDLMPSDLTGTEVLEEDKASGARSFRFIKGPVFANIVLADEINRTPPKTQSALLQSMQERHVTFAGATYPLPEPFFVLATQNPIEQEGTYPLPEAQLDRFMFLVRIDYPSSAEEFRIVRSTTGAHAQTISPILTVGDIVEYQNLVRQIPVSDAVIQFAVDLCRRTRPGSDAPDFIRNWITWGAGPRASQYLILGAKTRAALDGRPSPALEDVKAVAKPVLRHRLILNFNAEAEGIKPDMIVERLLEG